MISPIERIVNFAEKYGNINYSIDELRLVIPVFVSNNTFVLVVKDGFLVAFCIFNIFEETADVLECIIHPEHRNKGLLKYIAYLGWKKFPFLKRFTFIRERKELATRPRVYELSDLFKGVDNGKQIKSNTTVCI